jgi:hypothetical protein
MKTIINCETGEIVVRELNKAEKDQQKKDETQIAKLEADLKAEEDAKTAAKQAILDRIGLTADELKTILG